jgi:hypothetical protein
MHNMRVELGVIWERSHFTRDQLLHKLQDWCNRAEASGIKSCKTSRCACAATHNRIVEWPFGAIFLTDADAAHTRRDRSCLIRFAVRPVPGRGAGNPCKKHAELAPRLAQVLKKCAKAARSNATASKRWRSAVCDAAGATR